MIDLEARKSLVELRKLQKLTGIENAIKGLTNKDSEQEMLYQKGLTKVMLQRLDMQLILLLNILKELRRKKK